MLNTDCLVHMSNIRELKGVHITTQRRVCMTNTSEFERTAAFNVAHSSSTTRPMADDKVKDTMETPVFINVIFVFFRVLQTHCCQLEFWPWREKKIPDSFNTKWFPDLFSAFPDLFRIFFRDANPFSTYLVCVTNSCHELCVPVNFTPLTVRHTALCRDAARFDLL